MAEIESAFNCDGEAKTLSIAWNAADVLFHQAILRAAGNELLVPLGLVIESALGQHVQLYGQPARRYRPDAARA
jgi:DNA-binding FadR family transcriptional regulator